LIDAVRRVSMGYKILNGRRLTSVIELRNAAIQLLGRAGQYDEKGALWFQRHTAMDPEPRLTMLLTEIGGYLSLNVWATLRGRHVKVLNVTLIGSAVDVISFRRGDWETELRAMGRAPGVAVN
jgi:hypothetical protein